MEAKSAFAKAIEVARLEELSESTFRELATGKIGALRVPEFWTQEECATLSASISSLDFDRYHADSYPDPAFHIGPSLNEHRLTGKFVESYWTSVDEGWARWAEHGVKVHQLFRDRMASVWLGQVRPAKIGERECYWGLLRRMNSGTLVHWDDIRAEFPGGLLDEDLLGQLSVNVFLSGPAEGGALKVWSTARELSHEQARRGYGYDRDVVVPEAPEVDLRPHRGDAVFFSSRNYHLVDPVISGDRVSFTTFLGLEASGDLVLWS